MMQILLRHVLGGYGVVDETVETTELVHDAVGVDLKLTRTSNFKVANNFLQVFTEEDVIGVTAA